MATMTGGNALSKKLTEMAGMLSAGKTVRIGFLENARYPDGKSVAMIAAINEWGAPSRGQPPRPAFRNMIAAKKNEWPKAIGDLLVANNFDADKTLAMTGEAIAGQLRQSITEITSPPLKPATIKRKGFDKPWIETSHLLNSVSYEVKS
jgi:hypothetical protein